MKFFFFHLMPYRPLDLEAAAEYRSVSVVLPNTMYDPVKGAEEYESHIDLLVYAEDLGFDGISVNEHHQTAYGMMPAPNLIASALIQRTKNIKIAVLGRALPLVGNPMYIAEEFAMLDNLSKGRLIAGFVRGIGAEYHASGINPYYSHERYHEAHDLIVRAWTEPGPWSYESHNFDIRYVNLWPRPYQQPHPPVWIPSQGSRETISWAAHPDRKYPFLVTFMPSDAVIRNLNGYRDQARDYGYEAPGDQLGWAVPIYVGETDEQARAEAQRGLETLFNDYIRMPAQMIMPPGYTSITSIKGYLKTRENMSLGEVRLTVDDLIASGTAIVGNPDTVRKAIEGMREQTGFDILIGMFQFGVLTNDLARKNLDLFAAKVMPRLRTKYS